MQTRIDTEPRRSASLGREGGGRSWRVRWVVGLALGGVLLGAARVHPQEDVEPGVLALAQEAREATRRWQELNDAIAAERENWRLGKQLLQASIDSVERRIEDVTESIQETQGSITAADEERLELIEENEQLKAATAGLDELVAQLERRMKALFARMPLPARDLVRPLAQRIPEDPDDTSQSLGLRYQNVVGALTLVNKTHQDITTTSEVREVSTGESAEVATIYIGLSQAYYVSADGRFAGVGFAGEDGWDWRPADEAAPEILRASDILEGGGTAAYVQLPLEVE